jgi:hypothetical protein
MYNLALDEKTTPVMVYSRTKLIHGNLVTKKEVRVNIWLRMREMKGVIRLLKTEVLLFGGPTPQSLKYNEYFFPVERIIGFHLAPPAAEPLDYDSATANLSMQEVDMLLGVFKLKGKVLISRQTDFVSLIERSENTWFSVYDAAISNPFIPQMPPIHTPMLLVNPAEASFGMLDDSQIGVQP